MQQQYLTEENQSTAPLQRTSYEHTTTPSEQRTEQKIAMESVEDSAETTALVTPVSERAIRSTDVEIETGLKRLRRQAKLSSWLNGIAWAIATLAFTIAVSGLAMYVTMSRVNKVPVHVKFSPDLFSFGVIGVPTAGSTTMTFSGTLPLLVMIVCGLLGWVAQRKRIAMTRIASQFDDVRAVGPLIEALYIQNKPLRSEVATTLTRLVPRMCEEDGLRLDTNQRNLMNLYVGRSKYSLLGDDRALPLAILQAYPTIGNGTELTFVRRVAKGHGSTGKDPRAQQAAQDYLDIVEQRKQRETLNTTLLRASSASEIGSDTLLRAAQENQTASSNELLRPATHKNDADSL